MAAQKIDRNSKTRVAREGFDLYYRVYGSGHPVAILAGGPGFDCDYLEPVAVELAKSDQAILIELRGTGRSIPPVIDSQTINQRETLAENVKMRLAADERHALESTPHADFGHMLEIILPGYFFDRSNAPVAGALLGPEKYHP